MELGFTWKEFLLVVFAAGSVWYELKAIRRALDRLEAKVEKHNHFDRRIIRLETLLDKERKNA